MVSFFFPSYFRGYDMKANDGEFDEEDLEDDGIPIPRRYIKEDKEDILITRERLIVLETCAVKCSEWGLLAK